MFKYNPLYSRTAYLMVLPFVGYTRYLSSIGAVLLTLKLGGVESQKASLICPLLYHATIALCEHAFFFLQKVSASVGGWMDL